MISEELKNIVESEISRLVSCDLNVLVAVVESLALKKSEIKVDYRAWIINEGCSVELDNLSVEEGCLWFDLDVVNEWRHRNASFGEHNRWEDGSYGPASIDDSDLPDEVLHVWIGAIDWFRLLGNLDEKSMGAFETQLQSYPEQVHQTYEKEKSSYIAQIDRPIQGNKLGNSSGFRGTIATGGGWIEAEYRKLYGD